MFLVKRRAVTFSLIALVLALSGCARYYRHPNYDFNSPADFANFDADSKACLQSDGTEYCFETKDKPVTICVANGSGGHTCREQPQKKCTTETFEQCLYRKGWRKADSQGNYLE